MKLKRIRLEHFKRFSEPWEVTDLTEGLNLFVAPNESGKSTVAEAIRAAFFERHKSGTVTWLRPWSDPSATPTVAIDFDIAGKPASLTKAFLGKKRCHLTIEGRVLDGLAAEDHLSGLLGFTYAGKGASTPEHMGIPGLLWIKQGTSHEIAKPVEFASDHLRNALGDALGELAASRGDEIIRQVEAERNELLTPSAGSPRGPYQEALKRRATLEETLSTLEKDIQAYQGGVDRLARMRAEHDQEQAERPWLALQAQLEQAQARLSQAQGLAEKKAAQEAVLVQATAQVTALRGQLQAMERDEHALDMRKANLIAAEESQRQADVTLQAWQPRQLAASQAHMRAREMLETARHVAARQAQEKAVSDLQARVGTLESSYSQAQALQEQLTQLQAQAQALVIDQDTLDQLRDHAEGLRNAKARLEAISTTLEFELEAHATVRVGQRDLAGATRLALEARTDIDIDGVGRITVVPGGDDLEELIAARDRERDALTVLLQHLGVASSAAAEERARLSLQRATEAKAAAAVLAAHAPHGLASLATELATQTAQLAEARALLETLPARQAEQATVTLDHAESEVAGAQRALEDATTGLNEARMAMSHANAQAATAADELAAVQATLSDPHRTASKAQASHALTDALAHQVTAQQRVSEFSHQLETVNLPLLEQDLERLGRSVTQAIAAHTQRGTEITRLEAELEAKGALGLEEAAAETSQGLEQERRRCSELERRALALDHLLTRLVAKRSELARSLRAPLQKHLNRYLQILFPGANIDVGDDLSPGGLTRLGAHGAETGVFADLSVGAREQVGVIARLAYADLLQEAGKPTLLILDDALVHTDEHRLGDMKRVLYDAATRHQILIFSCHGDAWRDLGVAPRPLC
ncbi:AAA family ATPase [Pseudoxanthomonas mexicana]